MWFKLEVRRAQHTHGWLIEFSRGTIKKEVLDNH
jgi:hypothetical protein